MSPVIPVILSGGSGTRLWPVSQAHRPKQLAALVGDRSLFQVTVRRAASIPGAADPVVVCGVAHADVIADQLAASGDSAGAIIVEPSPRNTAPAVAAAALSVDEDNLLLVLPADHLIADEAAFAGAAERAVEAARDGYLVSFGVSPTRPETGYGYIRQGAALPGHPDAFAIDAFVEKPDSAAAASYVEDGSYSWNSGMFVFRAGRYLEELRASRPDIEVAARGAVDGATRSDSRLILDAEAFAAGPAESIDYAVMEQTTSGAVVRLAAGWSDIGSWHAMWETSDRDRDGNFFEGPVHAIDVSGSYVRAGDRPLAVVGLEDVVVVDTADGVLVAARGRSQDVKAIVARLEEQGAGE